MSSEISNINHSELDCKNMFFFFLNCFEKKENSEDGTEKPYLKDFQVNLPINN